MNKTPEKPTRKFNKCFLMFPAVLSIVLLSCNSNEAVSKGVAHGYCQDGCLAQTASLFVSAEAIHGPLLEQKITITFGLSGFLAELLAGKWDSQSGEKKLEVIDPIQPTCYEVYRCIHSETTGLLYQTEKTLVHREEGTLLDQLISEEYSFDKGGLVFIDHLQKRDFPEAERYSLWYQARLVSAEEDAPLALRLFGEEVTSIAGTPCELFELTIDSSGKIALS